MGYWKMPTKSRLAKYGLSVEGFVRAMDDCGGKCPLCGKSYTRTRLPAIDHSHRSGLFRGIICAPCNDRLGWLHEDTTWLLNAANYLAEPPARRLGIYAKAPDSPPEVTQ